MVYALCFFHIKAYVFLLSNYVIKKKASRLKILSRHLLGWVYLSKKKKTCWVGFTSRFVFFLFFDTLVASTFLKIDMICLQ